jgi:hypothetical protein
MKDLQALMAGLRVAAVTDSASGGTGRTGSGRVGVRGRAADRQIPSPIHTLGSGRDFSSPASIPPIPPQAISQSCTMVGSLTR